MSEPFRIDRRTTIKWVAAAANTTMLPERPVFPAWATPTLTVSALTSVTGTVVATPLTKLTVAGYDGGVAFGAFAGPLNTNVWLPVYEDHVAVRVDCLDGRSVNARPAVALAGATTTNRFNTPWVTVTVPVLSLNPPLVAVIRPMPAVVGSNTIVLTAALVTAGASDPPLDQVLGTRPAQFPPVVAGGPERQVLVRGHRLAATSLAPAVVPFTTLTGATAPAVITAVAVPVLVALVTVNRWLTAVPVYVTCCSTSPPRSRTSRST